MTGQITRLLAENAGEATALLMADHTAAAFLGISRATLWRRVKDGTLPNPIRIGAATRWKRDELIAAVERLTAKSTAEAMAVKMSPTMKGGAQSPESGEAP